MEEQNYRHEKFDDCFMCDHPVMKHILVGLLVFLGAFLAFYVVTDWHLKRMLDPSYQMGRMEKAMFRQEHMNDRMMRRELRHEMRDTERATKFIHVQKTPEAYKVIINLVPFNSNEKNVEVLTNDQVLTVNAAGEKNERNKEELVKFTHSFTFPEEVDLDKITKIREGNNYIISIPIEK